MTEERKPEDYDVRVRNYNLRRGRISHKEVNSFLEGLPDDAEHAVDTETHWATPYQSRMADVDDDTAANDS